MTFLFIGESLLMFVDMLEVATLVGNCSPNIALGF
jgi:hypothetical protein